MGMDSSGGVGFPRAPADETRDTYSSRMVRVAFLEFQLSLFRTFRNYLQTTQFDKQKFLEDSVPENRSFLDEVVDTQAFQQLVFYSMTKNSLPDLFEGLVSGSVTIEALREAPPVQLATVWLPPVHIILGKPTATEKDRTLRGIVPSVLDEKLLSAYSNKDRFTANLLAQLSTIIERLPELALLYRIRGVRYAHTGDSFLALRDYATYYAIRPDEPYGANDREIIEYLCESVSMDDLDTIGNRAGPVARTVADIVAVKLRVIKRSQDSVASLVAASPPGRRSGGASRGRPFGRVEVQLEQDGRMEQQSFLHFMTQLGLCPTPDYATKLFELLKSSERWRQAGDGVKNSWIKKLLHYCTSFLDEVKASYVSKLQLAKEEYVLAVFAHTFIQTGECGDLILTSGRIVFKCNRHYRDPDKVTREIAWKNIRAVERQDFRQILGGLSCLRIVTLRDGKKKSYTMRFWKHEDRDACFYYMVELWVGSFHSKKLACDKFLTVSQRNVIIAEGAFHTTKRRLLRTATCAGLFDYPKYPEYRWCNIAACLEKRGILNLQPDFGMHEGEASADPLALAARLLCEVSQLLFAYLTEDEEEKCDVQQVRLSEPYGRYCTAASELHKTDISGLTGSAHHAFFVNIYNALLIHTYLTVGFPTCDLDMEYIQKCSSYSINGMLFSICDIVRGVLGNFVQSNGKSYFTPEDPRCATVGKEANPHLFFLLATHLPRGPYIRCIDDPARLSANLEMAGRAYIQENVFLDSNRTLHIPQPLSHFAENVGCSHYDVVHYWILPHADGVLRKQLEALTSADSDLYSVQVECQTWKPSPKPVLHLS
mmetsp:Transcript_31691/g.88812  ORF Transcript_31691/g.88812 Transcript_31691/m.88812 type:complete len:825 (+) Transcript_31691:631-3105(+)